MTKPKKEWKPKALIPVAFDGKWPTIIGKDIVGPDNSDNLDREHSLVFSIGFQDPINERK